MRAGIYYRVSSEEQIEGFSLDAQRRILIEFCASKGWQVIEEYADEGKSARGDSIAKRPDFKRMIEDVEAGLLDVVVVHKLDRFARNIRVTFEYLELLARHNVKFVAVAQDVDYTKPEGRMFMGMLATLAQYYSDNLAQETKKGKAERKAQGWYNGLIPFGMKKGEDGIPIADPATIDGLLLAFRLCAQGKSDRDIAQALNAAGYRTTGNRGHNLFTKDTVRPMLRNRFYLGELPGERPANAAPVQHKAVIERELWDAAQEARECRASSTRLTVPRKATVYSLSGLGICGLCGSTLRIQPAKGSPRVYCSGRQQGKPCVAHSGVLTQYEQQIGFHLMTFKIPEDYRERLRAFVTSENHPATDSQRQRQRLESQLQRLKDLYILEDISKSEYLSRRDRVKRELAALDARETGNDTRLAGLAQLLANISTGWNAATSEQRNRLARLLFEEVVIQNERVVAVKPRPELAGFFALDYQARVTTYRTGGTDGHRTIGRPWHVSPLKSFSPVAVICLSTRNTRPPPHPEMIPSLLPLTIPC